MRTFNLGIVYDPNSAELAELSAAIGALSGKEPVKEPVFGSAGPNEIVQILVDASSSLEGLRILALCFGARFFSSLGEELGKLAAAEVWKKKAEYVECLKLASAAGLKRIARAIAALRAKQQTVFIAVVVPGTQRNAPLQITSDDPVEFAWQLANIMRCAPRILEIIEQRRLENPNDIVFGGNKIEILEDGSVCVLGETIQD